MRIQQDMPPPGGYPAFPYNAPLQRRGPSGALMFSVLFGVMVFGFYKVTQAWHENKERVALKRQAMFQIAPLLFVENDRIKMKIWQYQLDEEAKIMKDVPGWKVGESPYRTRWVEPAISDHTMELYKAGKI